MPVEPIDPRGLSVVCTKSAVRLVFARTAATLSQGCVFPSKYAVLALIGSRTLILCLFSRGTLLGTALNLHKLLLFHSWLRYYAVDTSKFVSS